MRWPGIRAGLNPHPSGQQQHNVPSLDGQELPGMQHKYRETVLYFPQQGQTCHAYCTYCFRWAQFVGDADLRFAAPGPEQLVAYLHRHPAVTDVLVTGGDPMIMSTERLRSHVEPLLKVDTVRTIRFGTKAVAYWPYRFVSDSDADDLLRLFAQVVASGRNVAVMAHFSHPRELATEVATRAIARIRVDRGGGLLPGPADRLRQRRRPRLERDVAGRVPPSARCLTTCSSSGTPDPGTTSRCR